MNPPPTIKEATETDKASRDRVKENLRRMGCYLILDAYEDLKRWIRPRDQYTQKQIKEIESGDPLQDAREFFFGEEGVELVIESFQISLNPDTVRRMAGKMIDEAEECISGQNKHFTIPQESWELLMETITQQSISENQTEKKQK